MTKKLDKQFFQNAVQKALKKMDYRACECGCKVNIRYPDYNPDGTCSVICPCCGSQVYAGKWKESMP